MFMNCFGILSIIIIIIVIIMQQHWVNAAKSLTFHFDYGVGAKQMVIKR